MNRAKDKGGWVVFERRAVSENRDEFRYLSPRFGTREEALRERDRMSKLPEYLNRSLRVTLEDYEPKKKRRVRRDLRQSRH
jgi:hypothetical protein